MNFTNKAMIRLLVFATSLPLLFAQASEKPVATIRRMAVLGAGSSIEVEITADRPLTPEAQVVTGPDRLVIDFANALPGSQLRTLLGSGEMKDVRVGLYKSNPPVTRVVLDLKSAQPYQLFPSGNTVIVKLSGGVPVVGTAKAPPEVSSDDIPDALPPIKPIRPASRVEVQFQNGNLSIWANKATLAEVLFEVHKRTGAEIAIPAGAEQEQVVTKIGPAPARDALATLLNGSRFNFIMVGSARDSSLKSVILSLRGGSSPQMSTYTPPPSPVAQVGQEPIPQQPEEDTTQEVPQQQPVEGAEEPIPSRDQPDPQPPQ